MEQKEPQAEKTQEGTPPVSGDGQAPIDQSETPASETAVVEQRVAESLVESPVPETTPTQAVPEASPIISEPVERKEEGARFWLPFRWELGTYLMLVGVAGIMRLWDLGSRAMHHDESLHAVYSWYLYTGRGYVHFPMMHGPFQFHLNDVLFFLFGDTEFSARLLYVIFGTALVFLPFFFRKRLGQMGALTTAVLLAFSPTMLYFSRFARNDIIMAVWALGLVICIWRYIDERKNTYLFIFAALLALAFSTQENTYILVAVLGSFLFSMALPEVVQWLRGRAKLSDLSPIGVLLLLLATLSLPHWSAAASLFDKYFGLVLANPDPAKGPVGAPLGGGAVVAGAIVAVLVGISMTVGVQWNKKVWLWCAALFYSIWLLFFTTFFTNLVGIGTGMWQGLGYWIAQQEVARGGQPWYYYFVITPTYEFLPLLFSIIAGVYYLKKRDLFGGFLVYWCVLTFFLYTAASEKMPWILVNVALPFIVLAGKFLGEVVERIRWKAILSNGGLFLAPATLLFVLFFWRLVFYRLDTKDDLSITLFALIVFVLLVTALGIGYVGRRVGQKNALAFCGISFAVILLGLTIRAGWIASYRNGDTPVEMLVYTQTSPDIPMVMREIDRAAKITGQGKNLKITIDSADGYTWPWAWYLRDYKNVSYPCYSDEPGCFTPQTAPDSVVVIVNARDNDSARNVLSANFTQGIRIKHRWWFPETYRGVTPSSFWDGLKDRSQWRTMANYLLYRKLGTELGSTDAYIYFSKDLPLSGVVPQ